MSYGSMNIGIDNVSHQAITLIVRRRHHRKPYPYHDDAYFLLYMMVYIITFKPV